LESFLPKGLADVRICAPTLSVSSLNRLRSLDLGLEIADNVIQEAREPVDEVLIVLVAGEGDPSVRAWFIRIARV
jgi:hypothetical protein